MQSPDMTSTGESIAQGIVYEVRPWQWYKQLIMYVAVVFSGAALDPAAWGRVTAGAVVFSLTAGATYILNDVADREADRNHPRKRHRPIASGQVPVSVGVATSLVGYAVAAAGSWLLDPVFFGLVAVYVGQNVAYSAFLKQYLFVDLFSISAGFVLRAIAGVVLLSVRLSPWILLCTFLTALMLGVSKRLGEHDEAADAGAVRASLDAYSTDTLRFLLGVVATLLLMSYSLYTFFARELEMMATIPFAFYAVFSYVHLTLEQNGASEPAALLLVRPMLVNFFVWTVTIILVLYGPPPGGVL